MQGRFPYLLRDFAPINNEGLVCTSPTCDGAGPDVWGQLKVRRKGKEEESATLDVQESIPIEHGLLEVSRRSLEFYRSGVTQGLAVGTYRQGPGHFGVRCGQSSLFKYPY